MKMIVSVETVSFKKPDRYAIRIEESVILFHTGKISECLELALDRIKDYCKTLEGAIAIRKQFEADESVNN